MDARERLFHALKLYVGVDCNMDWSFFRQRLPACLPVCMYVCECVCVRLQCLLMRKEQVHKLNYRELLPTTQKI